MEPADITILAIQNPGDAEATIVNPQSIITPDTAIKEYGGQIKQGAFVSLTDCSPNGNTVGACIFVADRAGDVVFLHSNAYMSLDSALYIDNIGEIIDNIGEIIASRSAPLIPDEANLETFTVFGTNDDGYPFRAVVSATKDTVYDVGVKAGLVDEGYEGNVSIAVVLKGDQSGLESVTL